jgi:predicted ATPase
LAQRQIEIDNLRENSHRQLMEAWARNGRRREALSHYDKLCQLLQKELAIQPEPETQALIEAIRAGELSRTQAIPAPQSIPLKDDPEHHRHNLPQRLTSFVGREKEIAAITDLITQHRLVMLTGVGGIGKTNLCLQVGRKVLDSFPDGVWLVELAPIADPALVAKTTANTLGLRESSERSLVSFAQEAQEAEQRSILQILLDYLQEKECLLILDNCEHVIESAAQLVETLLQATTGVKVLASSREALGVLGEIPFRVPSLTIPSAHQLTAVNEWQQYDALTLFVDRATAVSPEFQVTEDNFPSLVQICQRLDGIPLALELAAARISVLNTAQIAARLDDRFRLLTGGSRTALPRQQTLRALIDWSWDLLTETEQILLQRLSVFAGGMSLEAVEAVCAGDGLDSYDLLDLLSELVRKSLVLSRREQEQPIRYHLLETIRQYAQERLVMTGQGATFRQRHLAYFMTWAKQVEPELIGPDQALWLNRLDKELDNMRAALNWAREIDCEAGLQLITAVWRFWNYGYVSEGEMWLDQLMANATTMNPAVKAKALQVWAIFNFSLFKREEARPLLEKSLALYQALDDEVEITNSMRLSIIFRGWWIGGQTALLDLLPRLRKPGYKLQLAESLSWLSYYAAEQNNYEQATAFMHESIALFREMGHLTGLGDSLHWAGQYAIWQGEFNAARLSLEESLAIQKQLGERRGFNSLQMLGVLHLRLGNYRQAVQYLHESLALTQQSGAIAVSYWTYIFLGYVHLRLGELEEAHQIFTKSLRQFNEVREQIGVVFTLEGFASLAVKRKQADRAARLFAFTARARMQLDNPRPFSEQADVARDMVAIREMIDEETFDAAYVEGKVMTLEEAMAYALEG